MKFPMALLAVALAPLFPVAVAAEAESAALHVTDEVLVQSIPITGVLDIDAQGVVKQISLRDHRLIPSAEKRIHAAMSAWRFEPIEIQGGAETLRTSVFLRLDEMKSANGYRLAFGKVEFGLPLATQSAPPSYPLGSLRDGIAAEVLLRLTLGPDGDVVQAEPVMARVLNKHVRNEHRHRRLVAPFVRASLDAAQAWTYEFVQPNSDGQAQELLVPFVYTLSGRNEVDAEGNPSRTVPVLFELSRPLGRPIEALAREAVGRPQGLPIAPIDSSLTLRAPEASAETM